MRKEPLQVICVNLNSTKLIKGATYTAQALYTSPWGVKNERYITIKNVGSYVIKNFTLLDGRSLDNEPDFQLEDQNKHLDASKDYTGQFVRCKYSTGKILKEDEIYYVEKQQKKSLHSIKLKLRGVRNYISSYRFKEIPLKQQRNIKLKNLKGEKIKTGEQTRKFLLYSENEKIRILFETLTKVIVDLNNTVFNDEIDLIGLMVIKGKRNYNLTEEDVKPFLKNKLETTLKIFLNKK